MSETRLHPVARRAWLLPPALAVVGLGAAALVLTQPTWLLGAVLAVLLAAGFVWIVACALSPTVIDRRCPRCGAEALGPLDPESTRGLRCDGCGHEDPTSSSFYYAEESGALDRIVGAEPSDERATVKPGRR